jgi:hypothetical protein
MDVVEGTEFEDCGTVIVIQLSAGDINYYTQKNTHTLHKYSRKKIYGRFRTSKPAKIVRIYLRLGHGPVNRYAYQKTNFSLVTVPAYMKIEVDSVLDYIPEYMPEGQKFLIKIEDPNSISKIYEILRGPRKYEITVFSPICLADPRLQFLHKLHEVAVDGRLVQNTHYLYHITNMPRPLKTYALNIDPSSYSTEGLQFFKNIRLDQISREDQEKCNYFYKIFNARNIEAFSYCLDTEPVYAPDIGIKIFHYYDSDLDTYIRQRLNYPEDYGLNIMKKNNSIFPNTKNAEPLEAPENGRMIVSNPKMVYDLWDLRELFVNGQDLEKMDNIFIGMISRVLDFIDDTIFKVDRRNYSIQLTATLLSVGLKNHIDGIHEINDSVIVFNLNTRIYYDMLPIFVENRNPFRLKINSGDVVLLTGESRYLWSHSYPKNIPLAKKRYNLIFRGKKCT